MERWVSLGYFQLPYLNASKVVTWGDPVLGGDSSSVAELNGTVPVRHIVGTEGAFAAQMADGGLMTWGHLKLFSKMKNIQSQSLTGNLKMAPWKFGDSF